ncbi:leucine-rich repeat-containing protein 15-like [Paramacrobiotus metropolitanus]|uniref:leucine-rich repeat-containing protein 15-like n=1 Tax=Paramacrobiotus metropolitanus TaxID=2943436 RepID=UPI00244562C8|nr:leucine-rich repeat-containing protein 15-like [Paramacrobiotus metropolitanus]
MGVSGKPLLLSLFLLLTKQSVLTTNPCSTSNPLGIFCGSLTIPDQFNASQFPTNTTMLSLGDDKAPSFLKNAPPLPAWPNLQYVTFNRFEFNDTNTIKSWLSNVKKTVRNLEFVGGRLPSLDSGMFDGFDNLETLRVDNAGLQRIQPGAFKGTPALTELLLKGNQLKELDWSVLPENVGLLNAPMNSITTLKVSSPPNLPNLHHANLGGNNITAIPAELITFLRNGARFQSIQVDLAGNPLIQNSDLCTTTKLQPLLRLADEKVQKVDIFLTCGDNQQAFCEPNNATSKEAFQCKGCWKALPYEMVASAYDVCQLGKQSSTF